MPIEPTESSVAATELAKLGKCPTLIRGATEHRTRRQRPHRRSQAPRPEGNDRTIRGELAHARYDADAQRYMSPHEDCHIGAKRRFVELVFSAVVAVAVLSLLSLYFVQ